MRQSALVANVTEDLIQQARTTAERGDYESAIAMLRPLAEAGTSDAQYALGFLALVEQKVLAQVEDWRERLASNGRQVLREAIDGPIGFAPEGKQYRFSGKTVTGKLITGLIGNSTRSGVPKRNRPSSSAHL